MSTNEVYIYYIEITFNHDRLGFSKKIRVELAKKNPDEALQIAKKEVQMCFGLHMIKHFSFKSPNWVNRKAHYILYNATTLKVIKTFQAYSDELHNAHKSDKSDKSLAWLNVTDPRKFAILADINRINNTDY